MQDYSLGETSVTVTRTVGDHVRILSVRRQRKNRTFVSPYGKPHIRTVGDWLTPTYYQDISH